MTALLFYILKVIVCSALFAGCYWWALRNRGCYHWNRFQIIASVALSFIIPLLNLSIPAMNRVIPSTTGYATFFGSMRFIYIHSSQFYFVSVYLSINRRGQTAAAA